MATPRWHLSFFLAFLALALTPLAAQARHRLEPEDGRILHMAGQSESEFQGYARYLGPAKQPMAYSSYHLFTELNAPGAGAAYFKSQRVFLDKLAANDTVVVLPHVGLALTPGGTVLDQINAGELDLAIDELASGLPLLGRPAFLRLGYEFNGHWNNYSAPAFVAAWRRIEAGIARNATTRDRVALVWDMSCDAVKEHGDHTDPTPFFPGAEVVDWWGINVFNKDPGGQYSSMPNASCVLDFVSAAASGGHDASRGHGTSSGFPVLVAESLPRFVAGVTPGNSWEAWFRPYFETLLRGRANVKAFSYINRDCGHDPDARPHCVGGQWGDARIQGPGLNETVGPRYSKALGGAEFVHGCSLECVEAALGLESRK